MWQSGLLLGREKIFLSALGVYKVSFFQLGNASCVFKVRGGIRAPPSGIPDSIFIEVSFTFISASQTIINLFVL